MLANFTLIISILSGLFLYLAFKVRVKSLRNQIVVSDPYFIATLFFFLYNVVGQFGRSRLDAFDERIYLIVSAMVCASSFVYLISTVSFRVNPQRFKLKIKASNSNAFMVGGFLALIIGYYFWIQNYDRVGGILNAFSGITNRVDRNAQLTSMSGNVPYTHFLYVAHCFLLAGFLLKKRSIQRAVTISTVSVLPLLLFFFLDGERTSLLRHLIGPFFIVAYLRLGGIVTGKAKVITLALVLFLSLALLGNLRSALQQYIGTGSTTLFHLQIEHRGLGLLIPSEFYGINYTLNRFVYDIEAENIDLALGATYLNGIGYIFPRSVYKLMGVEKAPTISDVLGDRVAYEIGRRVLK